MKVILLFVELILVAEQGQGNGHVAVEGSQLIEELLLFHIIRQLNAVDAVEHGAEVGGLNSAKLPAGGVLVQYGIEQTFIVEVLGNGVSLTTNE